jgi:uncharacterized SAM-dependent methyltransferase
MHLRSTQEQTVALRKAGVSIRFVKDETIWTESSHKYSRGEIESLADEAGFHCDAQWVDREWPFAESLFTTE